MEEISSAAAASGTDADSVVEDISTHHTSHEAHQYSNYNYSYCCCCCCLQYPFRWEVPPSGPHRCHHVVVHSPPTLGPVVVHPSSDDDDTTETTWNPNLLLLPRPTVVVSSPSTSPYAHHHDNDDEEICAGRGAGGGSYTKYLDRSDQQFSWRDAERTISYGYGYYNYDDVGGCGDS